MNIPSTSTEANLEIDLICEPDGDPSGGPSHPARLTVEGHLKEYTALGWAMAPCYGTDYGCWDTIHPECRCFCSCWRRGRCTQPGKHPIPAWSHIKRPLPLKVLLAYRDRHLRETSRRSCLYDDVEPNWGVILGMSGLVALDIDQHAGGADGVVEFDRLLERHGPLPETACDSRRHFLFRPPEGFEIEKTKTDLAPGVEFLGGSHLLYVAPSWHHSGDQYRWINPPWEVEVADLPEWVAGLVREEWAKGQAKQASVPSGGPLLSGGGGSVDLAEHPIETRIRRAEAWLNATPGAISGQDGHKTLLSAAVGVVRGFAVPLADAEELLLRVYNPKCSPPWSAHEIRHKVQEAHQRGRLAFGEKLGDAKRGRPSRSAELEAYEEYLRREAAESAENADKDTQSVNDSNDCNELAELEKPVICSDSYTKLPNALKRVSDPIKSVREFGIRIQPTSTIPCTRGPTLLLANGDTQGRLALKASCKLWGCDKCFWYTRRRWLFHFDRLFSQYEHLTRLVVIERDWGNIKWAIRAASDGQRQYVRMYTDWDHAVLFTSVQLPGVPGTTRVPAGDALIEIAQRTMEYRERKPRNEPIVASTAWSMAARKQSEFSFVSRLDESSKNRIIEILERYGVRYEIGITENRPFVAWSVYWQAPDDEDELLGLEMELMGMDILPEDVEQARQILEELGLLQE